MEEDLLMAFRKYTYLERFLCRRKAAENPSFSKTTREER